MEVNNLEIAKNICVQFDKIPEVNFCKIYGSLSRGDYDEYSDIDIEVDVSGYDNGRFLKRAPTILNAIYPVVFSDYAPSLLPNEYIVSCAISKDNPFLIVDIKCSAVPHIMSISKRDIVNDKNTHILKLWVANAKHYLRGIDCESDINRMYKKVFGYSGKTAKDMLLGTLEYLKGNCNPALYEYIASCEKYAKEI